MRLWHFMAVVALSTATLSARANSFGFTAKGIGGSFATSGVLTTTPAASGAYLVTSVTGTGVLNLIGLGGYHGDENLIYPTASNLLDGRGFAFVDSTGDGPFDVDLFQSAGEYFASLSDDEFSETIPASLDVAAITPEPPSLILIGTGLVGVALILRRRLGA